MGDILTKRSERTWDYLGRRNRGLNTPSRSIDDEGQSASGDGAGNGQGDEPAAVDPSDHSPL